jgi:transcriptional regulator with XRE-family HTH domain
MLNENIKAIRKAKGLTQEELAIKMIMKGGFANAE